MLCSYQNQEYRKIKLVGSMWPPGCKANGPGARFTDLEVDSPGSRTLTADADSQANETLTDLAPAESFRFQ